MPLQGYLDQLDQKTEKSKELWNRAKEMLPGGVAGGGGFLAPRPIYIEKAEGGKLIDVDGNEYIDLLLGGFPNILGHSPKEIVDPVRETLDKGTSFMLFQEAGIELASMLQKYLPHLEMIRFANTGTEATMAAVRVARAYTQRDKIAKPEGGYNGQHDYVLVSGSSGQTAGTDQRPEGISDCAGIPGYIADNTVVIPWNDTESTVAIIEEHAASLAAVIVEPVMGFGVGAVAADPDYLRALREVTEKHGVLLVYDEIVTGFRLSGMSGAVGYYGVIPDLACYGKAIAGGFPIGAFGGRREIMEKTLNPDALPEHKVFHSGTFTGNPISMAAGVACLSELASRDYAHIDGLAERLRTGITEAAIARGFSVQVTGVASVFYPHFNDKPVRSLRDKLEDDADLNRAFCMGLIANGIYMPPGHAGATCFAHTEQDIDDVLEVSERILEEMQASA